MLLHTDAAVGVLLHGVGDLGGPGLQARHPDVGIHGGGHLGQGLAVCGTPGRVGLQEGEGALGEQVPVVGVALDGIEVVGGDVEEVVQVPGHEDQVPGGVLVDVEVVGAAPVAVVVAQDGFGGPDLEPLARVAQLLQVRHAACVEVVPHLVGVG